MFGGHLELSWDDIREILGGGDNLRVRCRDGRVEAFSLVGLQEDQWAAAFEAAEEFHARRSTLTTGAQAS